MTSTKKAQQRTAKKKPYHALRAYLPDNKKERESIRAKLELAAKLHPAARGSVSYYILQTALAQAERDLKAQGR